MVEPLTIAASLSIAASIMSIAASVKGIMAKDGVGAEEAIESYSKTAPSEEQEMLQDPDTLAAISQLTTISDRLLDQFAREAEQCEKQHVDDRKDADGQMDLDQADSDAAGCMCNVLRSLRRHNKKQLPNNGPFKDWWDQYNCKL